MRKEERKLRKEINEIYITVFASVLFGILYVAVVAILYKLNLHSVAYVATGVVIGKLA